MRNIEYSYQMSSIYMGRGNTIDQKTFPLLILIRNKCQDRYTSSLCDKIIRNFIQPFPSLIHVSKNKRKKKLEEFNTNKRIVPKGILSRKKRRRSRDHAIGKQT
ncbi:hypothetical protein KPH14_008204 [Odynerus spinipes]|uniref:Uncharacterized protein n=1 Tax=Odynerus spinipes TaxID=1348599 RepID=A0AAD9RGV6_9HYME|nr:hypothetical protein KPH14_008204 [Odynerus spinipes]